MLEAYEIGISLALQDGVSAGIALIRSDLATLDRAIAATSQNLARLQAQASQTAAPPRPAPAAPNPAPVRATATSPAEPPDPVPLPGAAASKPAEPLPNAAPPPAVMAAAPTPERPLNRPAPLPPSLAPNAPAIPPPQVSEGRPTTATITTQLRPTKPASSAQPRQDLVKPAPAIAGLPSSAPSRPVLLAASSAPAPPSTRPANAAPQPAPQVTAPLSFVPAPSFRPANPPMLPQPGVAALPPPGPALANSKHRERSQTSPHHPTASPKPSAPPPTTRFTERETVVPRQVGPSSPATPPTAQPSCMPLPARAAAPTQYAVPAPSQPYQPPHPPTSFAPPPTPSQQNVTLSGDIILDGARVGRWITSTLARQAARPPAGPTGPDPRQTPLWSGQAQGF